MRGCLPYVDDACITNQEHPSRRSTITRWPSLWNTKAFNVNIISMTCLVWVTDWMLWYCNLPVAMYHCFGDFSVGQHPVIVPNARCLLTRRRTPRQQYSCIVTELENGMDESIAIEIMYVSPNIHTVCHHYHPSTGLVLQYWSVYTNIPRNLFTCTWYQIRRYRSALPFLTTTASALESSREESCDYRKP